MAEATAQPGELDLASTPWAGDDIDNASLVVLEVMKRCGIKTGRLRPVDLRPIVAPLLRELNLRVATPEQIEEERELMVHMAYEDSKHIARVREHLTQLVSGKCIDELPF